jgi:hypothetical protein
MTSTTQDKVLAALQNGRELTTAQIGSQFKAGNPTALINNLRLNGYAIYLNRSVDSKGRVSRKYRLGTPSRKIIAAGYRAMALGV